MLTLYEIRPPKIKTPYNKSVEKVLRVVYFLAVLASLSSSTLFSQCLVINEIMVNPAGADGTPPNSSEWIELMNTCDTPIDIGCMIIGDGDFSLTIPSGTTLQGGEVYTISSGLNGLTPDLNWNTCGCSSSLVQTGSLTDASEQLFVLDNTGNLISGVYWGTGSFPALVSSVAANGCSALTGITLIDDAGFESITITEGATNEVDCNGNYITSTSPSFGTTNSDQIPNAVINVNGNIVCQGSALNFDGSESSGVSFSWTFSNATPSTSNDQNPIGVVFNSFGPQTAELTVQNSCGDSNTASVTIQVDEPILPVISASGNTTICEGESLTLSTTAGGTLQWQLDGADLIGETTASLSITTAGDYTVVANNGVCTNESLPVVVTINPLPVASILTTDTEVCEDESLTLEAGAGFSSYNWSEGGVTISTLANYNVITSNAGTFTYELTVTENGCTSEPVSATVVIHAYPVVQITPAGPIDLCLGEQIALNSANNHEAYNWLADGVSIATTSSLNVDYQEANNVVLEATDNGCTSQSTPVQIISHPVATQATWTAPPYAINNELRTCLTEHPLLGVSNGALIQWYQNGIAIGGANGLIANATADGEYYFTASISGECELYSDTITVDLDVDMSIETTASKDTACEGEIVTIIPNGNFVSYSWTGGIVADTLSVTNSGIYIVTGHLVSCDTTDTVSVFFSPYPEVFAGDDFYSDCEENTLLNGQSNGDETYWEIDGIYAGGGDTLEIATPTRTSQLVMFSSLNGCEARDTVNIEVDCIYIYAPTAITPDGDGLNDVFRVYANGLSAYTLRIFNRYGQLVWETNDPEDVWTGGAPAYYLPNGVYTWQVEALDYNQNEALSKARSRGSILMIR
jgi:gliding motility-associated-like protein